MARKSYKNKKAEQEIIVENPLDEIEATTRLKMEVGIEECLHIEFEYNRSKYHLNDWIVGKVYFSLVRLRIKTMEVAIIKRETLGAGSSAITET